MRFPWNTRLGSFCAILMMAALAMPELRAQQYTLQGMTRIGEDVSVMIRFPSGDAHLLPVGELENRQVAVLEWRPSTREAVIQVGNQQMTLTLAQPTARGLALVRRTDEVRERRPHKLTRVGNFDGNQSASQFSENSNSASGMDVSSGNLHAGATRLTGAQGSQFGAAGGGQSNADSASQQQSENASARAITRPRISMLPLNSTALTSAEKENNLKNKTVGQRMPE